MKPSKVVEFLIDNIDPLGQGVSKINNQIVFIPKTLPGERGKAKILRKKGKVFFAEIEELTHPSPDRIESECPHFHQCGGCSYLHTRYSTEIEIKENTLKRAFAKFEDIKFTTVEAPNRFSYRNRVQLHYHSKSQSLGQMKGMSNYIIPTPDCLLPNEKVSEEIKSLYSGDSLWQKLQGQPPKGHVEIYARDNNVITSYNQHYAAGGFTQVNEEMNIKLNQLVKETLEKMNPSNCVELFGGNGNLSNHLIKSHSELKRIIFDIYPHEMSSERTQFVNADIFKTPVAELGSTVSREFSKVDSLIIDPPRSGYKELDAFVDLIKPKNIIYVSCDHQTLKRDLENLNGYKLEEVFLFDLFPSTFHFETVAILTRDN
ncbi:MAG: class I SAM-dependent RNA methyltransferase [Oligoflexia bacterium]|nr:class I SAM-dependent RNA methyltransferase [Oligoflexia bacterium]